MKKISIIGSCVTRDSIEVIKNKIDLKSYISRSSIISLVSKPPKFKISENDISDINVSKFEKRMIINDINKTSLEEVLEVGCEYLIFDFIDERFDLYNHKDIFITKNAYLADSDFELKYLADYKVISRRLEATNLLFEKSLLKLKSKLFKKSFFTKKTNNFKIILNKCYWADKILDENTKKLNAYEISVLKNINNYNRILEIYYSKFLKIFEGCFVINPNHSLIYSSPNNKWGVDYFHFSEDYYQDIGNKILQIIEK
jgi:hypothetical protein